MLLKALYAPVLFFLFSSFCFARTIEAGDAGSFYDAINSAHKDESVNSIVLAKGDYFLPYRVIIKRDNLRIIGKAGPTKTRLKGKGMSSSSSADVLFDISGTGVYISGVTLEGVGNHLIQVRAEENADEFHLSNCVLRDAYEQLFKVSGKKDGSYSDRGIIENCTFEYSKGEGPQFYIGGIDAHRSRSWVVRNNTFRNIASPSKRVAEHAIHFWNDSSENIVQGNTIINCDRGIGFGLGAGGIQNFGGLIEDNLIIHTERSHNFADVGIALESSPATRVLNNTVLLFSKYPNAIEYRFATTQNVVISGNKVNRKIKARNGARAQLIENKFIN